MITNIPLVLVGEDTIVDASQVLYVTYSFDEDLDSWIVKLVLKIVREEEIVWYCPDENACKEFIRDMYKQFSDLTLFIEEEP